MDERRIDRGDRQLDEGSTETQKDADKLVCLTEFLYEFDLRADNTWTEVATPHSPCLELGEKSPCRNC